MRKGVLILFLPLLMACHGDPPMVTPPETPDGSMKEHVINAHRTIAQSEETAIDQYIERRKWPAIKLDDGVRIYEYSKTTDKRVEYEDSVHIAYSVEAINGKAIYDNIEETYVAGRRQTLLGLDNAVLHLHYGSGAKVIVPSSLAYGIGGDGDRIPQSAILVIDVKVDKQ